MRPRYTLAACHPIPEVWLVWARKLKLKGWTWREIAMNAALGGQTFPAAKWSRQAMRQKGTTENDRENT
jgi:hypothetical protein